VKHDFSGLDESKENLDKIAQGYTLNINTDIMLFLVDHNA